MSDAARPSEQSDGPPQASGVLIGAGVGVIVLTIILVVAAVLLAANAEQTAPVVKLVRDVLIILMALELVIVGAAIVVFLIQVARFVNLMNNEVQPILSSASDTVNAVRGTAVFLSKHVTEPVVAIAGTLGGLGRAMRDIDAIRKAAGMAVAAASASWPTDTQAGPSTGEPEQTPEPPRAEPPDSGAEGPDTVSADDDT